MDFLTQLELGHGIDENQFPSVFELVAHDRMAELLYPAFQYVVTHYAQRYPSLLLPVYNRSHCYFALLMAAVQYLYIASWNGSFTEVFYGLKRVSLSYKKRLTSVQVVGSLFTIIIPPFLRSQCDEWFEAQTDRRRRVLRPNAQNDGSNSLFASLYPVARDASTVVSFVFKILYMYGKTECYDPWLYLLGLRMARLTLADYQQKDSEASTRRKLQLESLYQVNGMMKVIVGSKIALNALMSVVQYGLPLGIFVFRFIEWWRSSEYYKSMDSQPIPPPPPTKSLRSMDSLPEDTSVCPICLETRSNPAMTPTGFVFCYPCIFKYISEHNRCPVTHSTLHVDSIRKIYDHQV